MSREVELDNEMVDQAIEAKELIDALREGLSGGLGKMEVPERDVKDWGDHIGLIMPAWTDDWFGVKRVSVYKDKIPSIEATYELSDKKNEVVYKMKGEALTAHRTAAASALASSYLSRENSATLLMIGAGMLAPFMISAHAAIRPIKKVMLWNRSITKAKLLKDFLENEQECEFKIEVIESIEHHISKADIVCCATNSQAPLIRGEWLVKGQHLDLVGSYQPHAREANTLVIERASIYVDSLHALEETGDLITPMQEGKFEIGDVVGDLTSLCTTKNLGRKSADEITLFKSVGMASEDLIAAVLVAQNLKSPPKNL